jgi:hypothetical protein
MSLYFNLLRECFKRLCDRIAAVKILWKHPTFMKTLQAQPEVPTPTVN